MGDKRRGGNAPSWGSHMSTAAAEAFSFLNAAVRHHYRGSGDTASAARDRAAHEAGITPAQAERLWKRWRQMASVDGDVYRALRNKYEALIQRNEDAADAHRAERMRLQAYRGGHETDEKRRAALERVGTARD